MLEGVLMECPHCRFTIDPQATICNKCGRFVSVPVEQAISQIVAAAETDPAGSKAGFEALYQQVRPGDREFLAHRVAYLMGQVHRPPTVPHSQPAASVMAPPPPPAPAGKAAPAGKTPAAPAKPRAVTKTPDYRPKPPAGGRQAIFMDFNQSPREIVAVMEQTRQQTRQFTQQQKRARWLLNLLIPAGALFWLIDFLVGYNQLTFSLVAYTMWLLFIVGRILLRRYGRLPAFDARYELTQSLFETLKDDVSPKRTLLGWLDLTGAEQKEKKVRSKQSPSGRPVSYYRDEWLRLKGRLYDGNVLRLSLVEARKVREGYSKRGQISGKMKWKPGSSQSRYQLQLSISASPDVYQVRPFDPAVRTVPHSRFVIQAAEGVNGRITVKAESGASYDAWDVLNLLRFSYDHLQPLKEAA